MKKYLLLAFAALVLFSLFSCGDEEEEVSSTVELKSNQLALYFAKPNVVNLTNVEVAENYNGYHVNCTIENGENDYVYVYGSFGPNLAGKTFDLASPSEELKNGLFSFYVQRRSPDLEDFILIDCKSYDTAVEYGKFEEGSFEKGTLSIQRDSSGFHLYIDGVTKPHSVAGPIVCKLKIDVPEKDIKLTY